MQLTLYAGDARELNFDVIDDNGDLVELDNVVGIEWVLHKKGKVALVKTLGDGVEKVGDMFIVRIETGDTSDLFGAYTQQAQIIEDNGDQTTVFVGTVFVEPTY